MIQVLTILLPIAVMIGVGVWCRSSGFLNDAGIENIKKPTISINILKNI